MCINFKIQSLEKDQFSKYFAMSEQQLSSIGAYLFTSDQSPCYPCRVSLVDAEIGELVLAINYEHFSHLSPYKASGPIFIRKEAEAVTLEVNEVPLEGIDDRGQYSFW